MTLQELLGELQALALAYPGETPVWLKVSSHNDPLEAVGTASGADGVVVVLKDGNNA